MNEERARQLLVASGAMLEGHYVLSSGAHSGHYLQCALVLCNHQVAREIGEGIGALWDDGDIDVVVGPALGGIIVAYVVAEALGVDAIFAERQDGAMTLRRGFDVKPGTNVLIAEDVITTGGSAIEVAHMLEARGANVVGLTAIADRTRGKDLGYEFRALLQADFATYQPTECPLCSEGSQAVKPGSRNLK